MLPRGTMTIEILEDGTMKIETGDMGGVTHRAADEFMRDVTAAMGGKVVETKLQPHHHHHDHGHGHHQHH